MSVEQENKYNHLEELKGSDYQIVEGEPDITGWDVIDVQGRKIGDVDDVLFDPQTRAVRYIIVDLEDNDLDIDTEKKVLVPIGIAELSDEYVEDEDETEDLEDVNADNDGTIKYMGNDVYGNTVQVVQDDEELADEAADEEEYDEDFVYLPTVTVEQLLALPAYEAGKVSPELEVAIRNIFERPATTDTIIVYDSDSFYTHDHFRNRIYPTDETNDDRRSEL